MLHCGLLHVNLRPRLRLHCLGLHISRVWIALLLLTLRRLLRQLARTGQHMC